ncbi:MAG: Siderophore exporter MmpL4 [Firmicutes bacterium]|nr:Siderophore exporter MmpL4 [candidate division NPL-UPA2 bacterium]
MERLARAIVAWRKPILVVFTVASLAALALLPNVVINYDQSAYLPSDMPTRRAMDVMEREFGLHGSAEIIVNGMDIAAARRLRSEMSAIEGVRSVVWLGDVVDVNQPVALFLPRDVAQFLAGGAMRFHISFTAGDHSPATGRAVDALRRLNGADILVRGPAVDALNLRKTATSEIATIIALVLPVFLAILFLATSAWVEPLLICLIIGVSILINMGTNAFLGSVSFITHTTAGLLQFAVTMDYAIFLLHRFSEERSKGQGVEGAMTKALSGSFATVTASSLTTIAGFVALMFMRYGLGPDLGFVLAKGVGLSLIAVLTLLPALVIFCATWIERTHHAPLLPAGIGWARRVVKMRLIVPLVLLMLPLAFVAQGANDFLYGEGTPADEATRHPQFGWHNPIALLVPKGDIPREIAMVNALRAQPNVRSVQGLATITDAYVPRAMLPEAVLGEFVGERYTRVVIMLDTAVESPAATATLAAIRRIANEHYPEPDSTWLLGSTPAVNDIRAVVEHDFTVTNLVAILAVGAVIAVTFRSLVLPLLLILTIQAAIWLNMAIPYFTGSPLIFIGYMIVSAVQLGATIDYAILLTGRYTEFRREMGVVEAAVKAVQASLSSVVTSAAILATAGFTLGFVSGVPAIAALGMLIGRGAALSCLLVLTLLPQLLIVSDKLIQATTYNHGFLNERRAKAC